MQKVLLLLLLLHEVVVTSIVIWKVLSTAVLRRILLLLLIVEWIHIYFLSLSFPPPHFSFCTIDCSPCKYPRVVHLNHSSEADFAAGDAPLRYTRGKYLYLSKIEGCRGELNALRSLKIEYLHARERRAGVENERVPPHTHGQQSRIT